jgi:hypothetical protein
MPEGFKNERGCSDALFLEQPHGIDDGRSVVPTRKTKTRNMEIKIKGLVRRQLVYGFESEKDGEGQIIGSSVVKLARRNAFELVGLKRPALAPAWRWKMD